LALPTQRGSVPCLFGARVDAEQSGRIVLMRLDAFRANSLTVEPVENFKPVEGYAEGEWYATAGSVSFGFPERVAARGLDWALEEGAKQLNGFEAKTAQQARYPGKMAPVLQRALSVPVRSRKGIVREGWGGQWGQTDVPVSQLLSPKTRLPNLFLVHTSSAMT
jgi:hypothetical protein